jgi:uncharacterized membrane protein YfhO
LDSLSWDQKLKILSASGVTLILTDEILNEKSVSLVTKIENAYGAPLYLYTNKNALGSITFVSRSMMAKSFPEALQLMTKPEYNPGEIAILARDRTNSQVECSTFRILQQQLRKQERNYVVETKCDGYLVFTDVNYPGWRISLNDQYVSLKNANAIYSAIFVQKGTHRIKKAYFPGSFAQGAIYSFLALVILGALAFKKNPH